LKRRYKEILRYIENVRTEWKSDYFVYNTNRYMESKVREIVATGESKPRLFKKGEIAESCCNCHKLIDGKV